MEQTTVATISRRVKQKQVIVSSEHLLTKGKSCLANLTAFYNKVSSLLDKGRTVCAVYLDFSKAFDSFLLHPHREPKKEQGE